MSALLSLLPRALIDNNSEIPHSHCLNYKRINGIHPQLPTYSILSISNNNILKSTHQTTYLDHGRRNSIKNPPETRPYIENHLHRFHRPSLLDSPMRDARRLHQPPGRHPQSIPRQNPGPRHRNPHRLLRHLHSSTRWSILLFPQNSNSTKRPYHNGTGCASQGLSTLVYGYRWGTISFGVPVDVDFPESNDTHQDNTPHR